ncbi:hypothetical protein [Blastomonas fulva]|uniref:hypothetical protein n=1 Tax=Blastomonas fulva TaxID=1550728 RepID=UPI003F704DF4
MAIRIPLACLAVGHKPDRRRAWYDNLNWRSNCMYCDAPLIKTHNGWRTFADADLALGRCSKDEAKLLSQAELTKLRTGSDKTT